MKAMVRRRYGGPEVIERVEVARPAVPEDAVLVRVRAASLNALDWYTLTGTPLLMRAQAGLLRPKNERLGVDFAGVAEEVGPAVTDLRAGDEVYGGRTGAFAEYVTVRQGVARKPANLTFEEAAAVPVAAVTALQGLRDKGGLRAGERVLVNGASGGVGTFALQVAKALGAEVTAVCSTRNVEQARALGADRVIDYTREDFSKGGDRYDLILDVSGTRSWREYRRVLADGGRMVVVGAPKGNPVLGPVAQMARLKVGSLGTRQKPVMFISDLNRADLDTLRALIEAGKVRPVVERTYELAELPEALRQFGQGHARGKIVVRVSGG